MPEDAHIDEGDKTIIVKLLELLEDKFPCSLGPLDHEAMLFERGLTVCVFVETMQPRSATVPSCGLDRHTSLPRHKPQERRVPERYLSQRHGEKKSCAVEDGHCIRFRSRGQPKSRLVLLVYRRIDHQMPAVVIEEMKQLDDLQFLQSRQCLLFSLRELLDA